jgi:RNA-directed DNA polymerase
MTTELNTIAFKAQTHPKHRFHNMYGQLTAKSLFHGWLNLNKSSAAGIDGVTASMYEVLDVNYLGRSATIMMAG